jgi:adhesin/invasin
VKTISLKKVSAVAVASLGFGLLSVVPAQAAAIVTSIGTVGTPNQDATVGQTRTTTVGFTTGANTSTTGGVDTFANTGVVLTVPTGSSVTLADRDGSFSTATTAAFATTGATANLNAAIDTTTGALTQSAQSAAAVTGGAVIAGTVTIIPDVPGLYTVTSQSAGADATAYIQAAGIAGTVGTSGLGTAALGATTGGIARFTFTTPVTTASGDIFRFTSSGVGAITAATGINSDGTTANNPTEISGVTGSWAGGATWTRSDADEGTATITVSSTTAGTQTVTVNKISATTGAPTSTSTISITWGSAVAISAASTAYMAGPAEATDANFTSTSNAIPRSADKAAGTAIATVAVSLVGSKGGADARANTVRATMSGAGFVDVNGTAANLSNSSQRTDANTDADATRYVRVYADGTSGTGTLTVTLTDVDSGASLTLGTWTVTSTGAQASIAVAKTNYTIGKAGSTTGSASTTISAAGAALAPTDTTSTGNGERYGAFVIVVKDSAGNPVNASATPAVISSDTTVSSGGTCALDAGSATYGSSTNGVGYYNCSFATTSTAKSGGKATLTIRIADPDSTTGGFLTTTVNVTVGGSVSTEVLSFDKTSYAPGEAMNITRTATDSSGNPVFDGASAPAITFSKAVGGTAPGASFYVGGKKASTSSAGVASVFAPAIPGAFTMQATSGNATASALTATATVTDANAAANASVLTQIDALNAKIVALNALIAKIMKKLGVK